ncbi:MAG: formylglycine-generating enzyme family protein, partial [Bacteroidaceae bacterium]|nr:formylglycine-generating enzyme family protein [Bacteroidaceae bacterium]
IVFTLILLLLCISAQPQIVVKRCKTCKKPVAQCRYKGRHAPSLPAAIQQLERDMVFVEGGTLMMGATAEQGDKCFLDEPAHQATLSSFYICKHEVTQAEWEAVMGTNPSGFRGSDLPVESVNWDDCQTFIRKLNQLTGRQYRLPTEAEWEYAARGGQKSQGYKYSGSNHLDVVAWYYDNSGNQTHAVMTKQANELGLYDMSGNVWEWCSDWYDDDSASSQTTPKESSSDYGGEYRGGSWDVPAEGCRVGGQFFFLLSGRFNHFGLRLAL